MEYEQEMEAFKDDERGDGVEKVSEEPFYPAPSAEEAFDILRELHPTMDIKIMKRGPPPPLTEEPKRKSRFLVDDGALVVNRHRLGIYPIYAYLLGNTYYLSAEGGWMTDIEEDAFYRYLGREKGIAELPEDARVGFSEEVDGLGREQDDLLLFLLEGRTSEQLLIRQQGRRRPKQHRNMAPNKHSTFDIKMGRIFVHRYTGPPVKSPLEITSPRDGEGKPLYRWRHSGPSPLNGWESEKEMMEFLVWARYEKEKIEGSLDGRAPPEHPLDMPPLPEPFAFADEGFNFVKDNGAAAYLRTRELPLEINIGWDTSERKNIANVADIAYLHWTIKKLKEDSERSAAAAQRRVDDLEDVVTELSNELERLRNRPPRISVAGLYNFATCSNCGGRHVTANCSAYPVAPRRRPLCMHTIYNIRCDCNDY